MTPDRDPAPPIAKAAPRRFTQNPGRPAPHQCDFATYSAVQPRCTKPATCKWGDHWFCAEHGKRP